jgi:hypothetical protein
MVDRHRDLDSGIGLCGSKQHAAHATAGTGNGKP